MPALDPTELDRFLAADPSAPVVMLNLMRFVPGGEATYREYLDRFSSSGVKERYGVTVLYGGAGHRSLVAAEGGDWDMVALFRYPSRQHFIDMVNDPDYLSFEHLRSAAVATAVLQPTTPTI